MRVVFVTCVVAASLGGCLLDQALCGPDFVEVDGRCVVAATPPPFRPAREDAGPPPAALRDATVARDAAIDASDLPPAPWAQYDRIVVVDRTAPQVVRRTPRSPGFDLDAVEVGGDAAATYGIQVVESFLVPGPNGAADPTAALGRPERDDNPTTFVSLGGEGGYVALRVGLDRPLDWGDHVTVYSVSFDGGDDAFELFLCVGEPIDPARCLSVGRGGGADETRFDLTP